MGTQQGNGAKAVGTLPGTGGLGPAGPGSPGPLLAEPGFQGHWAGTGPLSCTVNPAPLLCSKGLALSQRLIRRHMTLSSRTYAQMDTRGTLCFLLPLAFPLTLQKPRPTRGAASTREVSSLYFGFCCSSAWRPLDPQVCSESLPQPSRAGRALLWVSTAPVLTSATPPTTSSETVFAQIPYKTTD